MGVDMLPPMQNPLHPGALVREDALGEVGLTATRAGELLDASRPNLSLFLDKQFDPCPEMR